MDTIKIRIRKSDFRWISLLGLLGIALLLGACEFSLSAAPADTSATDCSAESFVVTAKLDSNDGACNSHCSLREAVIAANACEGENTIELETGIYELTMSGLGEEGGDLDITDNVVISGFSRDRTVILGREGWDDRIFRIEVGVRATIEFVTIRGGNTDGYPGGGGIHNLGDLRLYDAVVRDNHVFQGHGGGILNEGSATLQAVAINDNDAASDEPLLVGPSPPACGGGLSNSGEMTISDSRIFNNRAYDGQGICNISGSLVMRNAEVVDNGSETNPARYGGGIYSEAEMHIIGSLVGGNYAMIGGGIYSIGSHRLVIERTIIDQNFAKALTDREGTTSGGVGGGIYVAEASDFSVSRSVIKSNWADLFGGGIYFDGNNEPSSSRNRIDQTAIIQNFAFENTGGGLYMVFGGRLDVISTTFSGNSAAAGSQSGAIHFGFGANALLLDHVTIARNTGGILNDFLSGQITIRNSLITNNGTNCTGLPDIRTEGNNLEDGSDCPLDPSLGDRQDLGPGLIVEDLIEIDNTYVHLLPLFSLARDYFSCTHPNDQHDARRPMGDACDVGAVEMDAMVPLSEDSSDFPIVLITNESLCYRGPGPVYEVVSAVLKDMQVELAGVGDVSGWLVINSPFIDGEPCWVDEDVVEHSLDVDLLDIFFTPLLPTPTPRPPRDDVIVIPRGDGGAGDPGSGDAGPTICVPPPNACPNPKQKWSISQCQCVGVDTE